MKKFIIHFILTLLMFALASCSTYKMDIQQGNALTNEAISQLTKGMSKDEVATLLGTPLLQDNFRQNRWDYIYYEKKGHSEKPVQQGITLIFQNDRLIEVKR